MFTAGIVDQIDTPHTKNLFGQLGDGRNRGPADAIKIAVDTGMHAGHGDGHGYDAKQRRRAHFHQAGGSDIIGPLINQGCAQKGEGKRHKKACPQCAEGIFIVMCAGLAGYIFGDGSLYAGDGECKGEGKYRGNQLIDSHAFSTEYIGQKDSVEEADQAADESGQREYGCSGD